MGQYMRIAHLVAHGGLNGVATSCRTLIEAQRAAGHEIFLAAKPNSWLLANLDLDGIDVLQTAFKTRPKEISRVGHALREWGCDVVHCHGSRANKYGLVYRVASRTPIVATAHASHFQLPWRWFSAVIAPSRATADYHARVNWVPRRRIHLVSNAVALPAADRVEARAAARRALDIGDDEFVIGSVGQVGERKNQVDLLRALAKLPEDCAPVTLALVGSYPRDREPMAGWGEALAAASARHRVVLAGSRNDGAALVAAFDVFGFVSRMEQGPIAPLEAMAAGVPVLTYRVGNLPEIVVDGQNGFLVGQGDVDAFAHRIASLRGEPELLHDAGVNARATIAADLSPDALERNTAAVYRAVVGSRPAARPTSAGRSR